MITKERARELWEESKESVDGYNLFLRLALADLAKDFCLHCKSEIPVIFRNETFYHQFGVNHGVCSASLIHATITGLS